MMMTELAKAIAWWNRHFHPHTCGNNSRHRDLVANAAGDGFECPDCDYEQRGPAVDRLLTAYTARPTDAD